jgi:RNA polymerase sigma-70 factor (ECF subfamily)
MPRGAKGVRVEIGPLECYYTRVMPPQILTPQSIKQTIDAAPMSLVITDRRGVILYANQSSSDASGYALGEIIGKAPGKLWGGHMPASYYDRFWGVLTEERRPFIDLVTNLKKNSEAVTDHLHVAPILDGSAVPNYFIKLSPPRGDWMYKNEFSQSFRARFSNQDASSFDFFMRLFGLLGDSSFNSFQSLFENALIGPTREKYAARVQDAVLIAAAQNNAEQFEALYQKYFAEIYRHLLHRTAYNAELSADLTQDTFVQALRYLPKFTISNASYGTYLTKIAQNVLTAHFRSKQNGLNEDLGNIEHLPSPESEAADVFDVAQLRKILLQLSPIEQQILLMKYEKNLSVHEIAGALAKTENAVKLHLSRAREKMRRSLIN